MLQQQCLNQPENGSETTTSDDAACYSNLLRKPSQRLPQPCSRPPHRRRPNPPGLIIRGRVFHVRVAVPRKVQPTVGRTEVWRSLGTGNRSEAIRKSKVVIADLERSFWAAGGISAADAPATEIATRQPVVVEAAPVFERRQLTSICCGVSGSHGSRIRQPDQVDRSRSKIAVWPSTKAILCSLLSLKRE
ncbi:DUF6538 domain-containing protein [Brevundimonas sp.]|uniref:DUF6538 domain-containing protein n=1 Tax=Brevundimonas sp. TaxID=1871086 RepID=UPI003AFF7162